MMQPPEPKKRDVADEALKESLQKLQEILIFDETQPGESESESESHRNPPMDLAAFEDAVADIEAYMEGKDTEE